MAIVNRTLDPSEQRLSLLVNAGATATGATGFIGIVPSACVLEAAEVAALGISGSPTVALTINRFIVGTGFTAITAAVGTSNTLQALGTSGPSSMVIGSSLQLSANDVLSFQVGGTTSAVTGLSIGLVLRPLQDIVTHFGQI